MSVQAITPKPPPFKTQTFSRAKRMRIFKRDGWQCFYCSRAVVMASEGADRPSWASVDHRVPQSRGGSHKLENLVTACMSCNGLKRNKTADEFIDWQMRRWDWEEGRL
jgi:5-methylcytosine-specific restriction endonuclease McrA